MSRDLEYVTGREVEGELGWFSLAKKSLMNYTLAACLLGVVKVAKAKVIFVVSGGVTKGNGANWGLKGAE